MIKFSKIFFAIFIIVTLTINVQASNFTVISFIDPTPRDNIINSTGEVFVETSITSSDNSLTAFINWNSSLLRWMRLNEASGTITQDNSGNNNGLIYNMNSGLNNCTGKCSGWTSSGKYGNAINFDGVNDYVDLGPLLTKGITVDLWVKTTDTKAVLFPIGIGNTSSVGWRIQIENGINTKFLIYNSTAGMSISQSHTFTNGAWTHIVGTYDGKKMSLYTDGVLGGTKSITGDINYVGARNLWLGQIEGTGGLKARYFNGTIDEVRVYNRAISAQEVAASYSAGKNRLYHTFTNQSTYESGYGNSIYQAFVQDSAGVVNETEIRNVYLEWPTMPVNNVSLYTPPIPTIVTTIQDNFWINQSWQAGTGYITNSYNVSVNGIWTNGTNIAFYNSSVSPDSWINISVWAYNNSGIGSISSAPTTQDTQAGSTGQENWIILNNNTGELTVNDSYSLDNGTGLSSVTWSMWAMQNSYTPNAGLFGKYKPLTDKRSYLIRTVNLDGIQIVLSSDGTSTKSYSSNISRACGIQNNNEWTLITVTYIESKTIYYHNGVRCDSDPGNISQIYDTTEPLRIGGGNSVFFNGSMDDISIYNNNFPGHQVYRFYQESEHALSGVKTIPVLAYHLIMDPPEDSTKVSVDEFKKQMSYLYDNNFTTITTENFYQWQKGNFIMPKRPVIIIFDDGWSNTYYTAYPILAQYGYVASVGIVTMYADQSSGPQYMNWSQIRELHDVGWEISSHSVGIIDIITGWTEHANMLTLNETEYRKQLNESSTKILTNIGVKPTSFIFPFHYSNSTYTSICGEYYDLCWTYGSRDTWPYYTDGSDNGQVYQSLKRITVYNTTTMQTFKEMFIRESSIPAGAWSVNEGTGNVAFDSSGNGNNAVLSADAIWQKDPIASAFGRLAINSAISIQKSQNSPQEPPLPPSESLS